MNSNGVIIQNFNRTLELDNRISERNIPSQRLKPQYSLPSHSTKREIMPTIGKPIESTVPLNNYSNYSQISTFNPGTSAPWYGYANNVNQESSLRNQFFALQHCDERYYVPSSNSDLYHVYVDSKPVYQKHNRLFHKEEFNYFNPNTLNIGKKLFHNHTKNDILDL